jgi:GntR family transcriptional regulator
MPGIPMWRQIAEDLRQKIESGDLGRDGQALPSELELQDTYSASRNTIRDAVKWLVTRGLVVTRPGQGTFVVQDIDPFVTPLSTDIDDVHDAGSAAYLSEVMARRRKAMISEPRVEIQQARALVASELQLVPGATVVSRHQKRYIDGTPWSLQTSFYPMNFVDQGAIRILSAEDIPEGVVAYIGAALGINQTGRRDRLTVRAPNAPETDFFKLPDDGRIAVVELIQTGYDRSGQPIRVTVTSYPADRNQFVLLAGQVPGDSLIPSPEDAAADR